MSVEQVTYISDLDPTQPQGGDRISQGDDHLRNIKKSITQTFPNIDGEIALTDEELNGFPGVIDQLRDDFEASFDGNNYLLASGVINTENNNGIALGADYISPVDTTGSYRAGVDLGRADRKWNDLYTQNIHTDTMYTSNLVLFGRSMWANDGMGLYFGNDNNVYPSDRSAGRSDGVVNLGNPSYRFKNLFVTGSVLGRSLTSNEDGVAVTVTDVINSFEKIKQSAAQASTVEELRSSIVDTMGDLIDQMRQKQSERILELESGDYE